MRIEFNKVTWYSKLAAVILFVLVLLLGFYFGRQFQKLQDLSDFIISNRI